MGELIGNHIFKLRLEVAEGNLAGCCEYCGVKVRRILVR